MSRILQELPAPSAYARPCPTCYATGVVPGCVRSLVDNVWTDVPSQKFRKTCPTCRGYRYLDHPKAGDPLNEDEIPTIPLGDDGNPIAEPTITKKPRAAKPPKEPKAPKAAKEPKEAKAPKFPGTFDINEAIRIVETAVAAGEDLGKSRTWTVAIGGHIVAPKWITEKMTGVSVSDFNTGDAVKFLADMGLVAQKAA